jgi:hypothetical protein
MATIVAALVIMTTAGAGAALEPDWQLAQLLHHTGAAMALTPVRTLMIMDMLRRTPGMVTGAHITPLPTAARHVVASVANEGQLIPKKGPLASAALSFSKDSDL